LIYFLLFSFTLFEICNTFFKRKQQLYSKHPSLEKLTIEIHALCEGSSRILEVRRLGETVKQENYQKLLAMAFRDLHSCEAKHLETVPVLEQFQGKKVWEGEVEVSFALSGHPKATRGYAWVAQDRARSGVTASLEISPVKDPLTAVRSSIMDKQRLR
jgi:hypothetical protein